MRAHSSDDIDPDVTFNKNNQQLSDKDWRITVGKEIQPQLGQTMADGTFYPGRFKSKDGTEKDWFAAAGDAKDKHGKSLSLNFNDAAKYAKNSKAHGHDDWIVPPGYSDRNGGPDVLNAIFNDKAKIGGFDETGSYPAGCYWSSSPSDYDGDYARLQRFSDGRHSDGTKRHGLSARLVRSVAM